MRRVVVTGMSAITALGDDWSTFRSGLEAGKNAVKQEPFCQMSIRIFLVADLKILTLLLIAGKTNAEKQK